MMDLSIVFWTPADIDLQRGVIYYYKSSLFVIVMKHE